MLTLVVSQTLLASGSWDGSVRVWDPAATGGGAATESLRHSSEVLALAWRPDGRRIVVATRDGQLHFWDPQDGRQTGVIVARGDASGGRTTLSEITAKTADASRHFSTVAYSTDGSLVIAGGRTNYVCVYAAEERLLLRKFALTHNRDIDGVTRLLNSSRLTDTGFSKDVLDGGLESRTAMDLDDPRLARPGRGMGISTDAALPGATRGGAATSRTVARETRCRSVSFAPTGRAFAAASAEGLLLFSADEALTFDPVDLTMDVTPEAAREALENGDVVTALTMALHLNERELIREAIYGIAPRDARPAARGVSSRLVPRLLAALAEEARKSKHVEIMVTIAMAVLTTHSAYLRSHPAAASAPVRALLRSVTTMRAGVAALVSDNADMVDFIGLAPKSAVTVLGVDQESVEKAQEAVAAASLLKTGLGTSVPSSPSSTESGAFAVPSGLPSAWEDDDE
jgi:periodic tryptophan protein 2